MFEIGEIIAAGFIPANLTLFYEGSIIYITTRNALIVIGIIAIGFSLFIYVMSVLNVVNVVRLVPWLLVVGQY
jgi:hypothetical protein